MSIRESLDFNGSIREGLENLSTAAKGDLGATAFVVASNAPTYLKEMATARKSKAGNFIQVCDGVADNVEIQAANDALGAGGGVIHLSTGTFTLTDSFTPSSNVTLEGSGKYSTTLLQNYKSTITTLGVVHIKTGVNNITIKDLQIDGNLGVVPATDVWWYHAGVGTDHSDSSPGTQVSNVTVDNCSIKNVNRGISAYIAVNWRVANNNFTNCQTESIDIDHGVQSALLTTDLTHSNIVENNYIVIPAVNEARGIQIDGDAKGANIGNFINNNTVIGQLPSAVTWVTLMEFSSPANTETTVSSNRFVNGLVNSNGYSTWIGNTFKNVKLVVGGNNDKFIGNSFIGYWKSAGGEAAFWFGTASGALFEGNTWIGMTYNWSAITVVTSANNISFLGNTIVSSGLHNITVLGNNWLIQGNTLSSVLLNTTLAATVSSGNFVQLASYTGVVAGLPIVITYDDASTLVTIVDYVVNTGVLIRDPITKAATLGNTAVVGATPTAGLRVFAGSLYCQLLNNNLTGLSGTKMNISQVDTIIENNNGYISSGEVRTASGSLTAGVANAIAFAWHNPEAQDILIKKVVVEITTGSVTANSVIDVGIADDAAGTNRGVEFFNDLDANDVDVNDSLVAGDGGTQTKWVFCQDSVSATDGWIVGQILVADAAALVGKYYVEYAGR